MKKIIKAWRGVACKCSVKNIPYTAAQYIKDKLAESVRLIKV